jgi:hypothetical protein
MTNRPLSARADALPKKTYAPPVLVQYGNVCTLTQGGGGSRIDQGNGKAGDHGTGKG